MSVKIWVKSLEKPLDYLINLSVLEIALNVMVSNLKILEIIFFISFLFVNEMTDFFHQQYFQEKSMDQFN